MEDGTERERYEETQGELVDSPRSQPDLLMDWLLDASDDESDYEPPKQDPGDLPVPRLEDEDELKAELADLMDETAATGSDDEDELASSTEEGQVTDEDESGSSSSDLVDDDVDYLVDTEFDADLLK